MPKGDCFVASLNWVLENPSAVLVHGTPLGRGPIAGVRFGHAWVEAEGRVIDPSNDNHVEIDAEAYYALGEIDPEKCHRYTRDEVVEMMLKHETLRPLGRTRRRRSMTIWKFDVLQQSTQLIEMPTGAKILSTGVQGQNSLVVWALVDPDAPKRHRRINVCMTGSELYTHGSTSHHVFIGTVTKRNGIVLHVFEEKC